MLSASISVELTLAEALVLFEWIEANLDAERLPLEDTADRQALLAFSGKLESRLPVSDPGYDQLLARAQQQLRNKD
jgi:hypothetical protein